MIAARGFLVVLAVITFTPLPANAATTTLATCQGTAPAQSDCTATFTVPDVENFYDHVTLYQGFSGLLLATQASSTGLTVIACQAVAVTPLCPNVPLTPYVAGDSATLTVHVVGQGHWRVVVDTSTQPPPP